MDGFKNVEIRNFRGIEHLKIEDFSRVNVFLGQNSSGKSSVLESLLFMTGMSNPDLPQNINSIRARGYSSFMDLGYMFYNYNLKITPEFSSEMFDGSMRHLVLEVTYTFNEKAQVDLPQGQIPTSETKRFLNTLKMKFDIEADKKRSSYESSIIADQAGLVSNKKSAEGYLEKNSLAFFPADLSLGNPINDLVELAKRKQKDIVTERLKFFDGRITSLEILNNESFIGLEGMDQLMAVNMMGDGMRRYLNIVAASAGSSP